MAPNTNRFRSDDGSENWTNEYYQRRVRGQINNNSHDRPYNIPMSQQVPLYENPQGGLPLINGRMHEYSREAQRAMRNGNMPTIPEAHWQNDGTARPINGEINPTQLQAMLAQRIAARQIQQQVPPQQQQPVQVCVLVEGHRFFNPLQVQGFASTMPIVRTAGQLSNVRNQQFQVKGMRQCYVVDGLPRIDLQNQDPRRFINLVEVYAPFMGTILVPQEAIMMGDSSQQLLRDNRQYQQPGRPPYPMPQRMVSPPPQRPPMPMQGGPAKRILRG
jgi:hypothetical protein